MELVNHLTELENEMAAVGQDIKDDEKKRLSLLELSGEFSVTAGFIRATDKSLSDCIGLLIIQEANSDVMKGFSDFKNWTSINDTRLVKRE